MIKALQEVELFSRSARLEKWGEIYRQTNNEYASDQVKRLRNELEITLQKFIEENNG